MDRIQIGAVTAQLDRDGPARGAGRSAFASRLMMQIANDGCQARAPVTDLAG